MRIGLVIMSRGKITLQDKFFDMQEVGMFIEQTFPEAEILRYDNKELILKSGNEPVNIIIGPLNYACII